MATFYKESNNETAQDLYDKSTLYLAEMSSYAQKYSCVVDFSFAEKAFYGKVNRNFVSIEPNVIAQFKKLPNSQGIAGSAEVMSFVADAFAGLSRHFQRSIQIGAIRKDDPYLSNLVAFDGYQKPSAAYSNYFNTLTQALSSVKNQKQINIKDFDEFLDFFIDFSKEVGSRFPVTKSGYIRSRFNSLMNSGLAIEVSDIVYENDNEKIESFVNSPNFEYYLNACNSYGFMVDVRAPWRIVADIDSIAMRDFASRYGYRNPDSVLLTAFKKSHDSGFRQFSQQLLSIYNTIVDIYTEFENCGDKVKAIIVEPKQYTIEQINNLYNEDYFIKLYCMLRLTEEEDKHSKAKQDQIITDTLNLSRAKDLRTALGRFERFVSQPFDYRGSLSYLIREQEKREDT
jgi:hypothetical protein